MANIVLSNRVWYKGGTSGASYVVGYEASSNRVVRYTMTAPSTGASSVSFTFQGNNLGDGSYPSLRFYIGKSSTSHTNAGAGSEYTGTLARQSDNTTYTGSADIVLMPNETYYVWVFPANTTYGWLYWSATTGHATATTSGGAYSTMEIDSPQILDEPFDIAVTRYDDSFTHTVTFSCGTATGAVSVKSSTIPISCRLPIGLANQAPNSTTLSVTLTLTTYDGDTAIGSVSKQILCLIPSEKVAPTISVELTDAMGYKDTYGDFIQGRSKLHFKVTATGLYGATINFLEISCNGETFTEAEGTTGVLTAAGGISFRVGIVDSRNHSETEYFYPYVLSYNPPQIKALSVKRCSDMNGTEDDQGGYIQVKTSGSITSLSGKNSAKFQLWYKKSADTDYTKVTLSTAYSINNETYSFAADTGSSYDVMIVATDAFTTEAPVTKATSASTGYTIMHWKANGKGMAIGKVTEGDRFEVGMDAHFYNAVTLEEEAVKTLANYFFPVGSGYVTSTNQNPASVLGGTWSLIDKQFANYTFQTTNDVFVASENVSSYSLSMSRSGHSLFVRLMVTPSVDIADVAVNIGTFDFTKMGVSEFVNTLTAVAAATDTGDGFLMCQVIRNTGAMVAIDFVGKGDRVTLTAGNEVQFIHTFELTQNMMLDSACDQFIWKRTA